MGVTPNPTSNPIYATGVGHVGPKSSISFYAYNIPTYTVGPDGRRPGTSAFPGEPWSDGQNPSEVPLTNASGSTYSHTVGGGAIVLEPSGNRLLYADDQYGGNETPYELNFYLRSGGATGAAPPPGHHAGPVRAHRRRALGVPPTSPEGRREARGQASAGPASEEHPVGHAGPALRMESGVGQLAGPPGRELPRGRVRALRARTVRLPQ